MTEFRKTDITIDSFLDFEPNGNTNVLVGRWASADMIFLVENMGSFGDERVRTYARIMYDERKVEDEFFLFRSDGESLGINVWKAWGSTCQTVRFKLFSRLYLWRKTKACRMMMC